MTAITKTIMDPALGERALAVHPPLVPGGDTADFDAQGWGRRTRYVAGRSVTDRALQTDQRHVEGHLATAGQRLAPGVAVGLELTVDASRSAPVLHLAPGMGVCLNGEDVRVMQPVELDARLLWVVSDDQPQRLGELLDTQLAAARAFIVQLRPVVVERTGDDDADHPCEVDPDAIAFTDEQLVDGCRVRLIDVKLAGGLSLATFRNELAYQLFELEAAQGLATLTWQTGGLPIAVLGFPPGASAAPFVDIHAAARRGGTASHSHHPSRVPASGNPALWQARFEQFIAQIADSNITTLTSNGLASEFRWLPPLGMLPPGTIDVRGDIGEPDFPLEHPSILPAEFVFEAIPVELEALDDYLGASISLAPFDTSRQEQLQLLVPVPQQHFDPDLLIIEDETPDEFRDAIERFLLVLNHRLGRRLLVRAAERHVARALYGVELVAAAEPTEVVGEVDAFYPVDQVLTDAGLPVPPEETLVGAELTPRLISLLTQMYNAVGGPANNSPINPLSVVLRAAALEAGATAPPLEDLDQDEASELADLFLEYRFGGQGMVGFSNFCVRRLVLASERITLAFERMQAELHRIRQYVSGTEAANQLASSPVISAIAVRDPSAQAPLQLSAFASVLRKAQARIIDPSTLKPTKTTLPTKGIATGGRAIASSILFDTNLLQRLDNSPPAFDASANADRATRESLRTLLYINDELGLSLAGILFPERLFNRSKTDPPLLAHDPITIDVVRTEIRRWLDEGRWEHEFDTGGEQKTTEADFFGNAVRRLEEMVAVLRIVEARLTAYEAVVDLLRDEITVQQQSERSMQARLAQLQDEIEELRHDIRVARALEREEVERAVRVNKRRAQVIAEHVPFLLFRRPRSVESVRVPPSISLATASDPDIVPDCLDDQIVPPEQLGAMLDLLRELPLNRLRLGPGLLAKIDRQQQLLALAEFVRHTSASASPVFYDPFVGELFSDRTGLALRARYAAQRELNNRLRTTRGQLISTTAYRSHSWSRLQAFLQELVTVGDILAAPYIDRRWVQPLAQELDNLARVSACLYERFHGVPPLIRLAWVQQVSEQDDVVIRLDDLSKLDGWESVDRLQRRDLQSLVDWLFARFNPELDDGRAFISDVVRVALLLSGHAPVQRVIDAVVIAPHPVALGGIVRLQLDPGRVRVGMHVSLYADAGRSHSIAAGVVDDLADGVVAVRLVSTTGATVRPTHALVSDPSMGPKVTLAGGRQQAIGVASKLS
jgi:hypothetical protein